VKVAREVAPTMNIRRVIAAWALAFLASLSVSQGAVAQTYTPTPPPQNVLELSTNFPDPGGPFTARGCGFAPGTPIDVTIGGATVASITAGSDGCGFTSLVAPSDPGTYTVCFTGLTPSGSVQQLCDTITVRVAGAATAIPAGQLPFTGSANLAKLVVGGMLMVAVGGMLLIFARRRAEEY
jgi:hypothetical protein